MSKSGSSTLFQVCRALILASIVLSCFAGCASMEVVRDFAAESVRLTEYGELTTHFRDTYQREKLYLFGEADSLARENDRKRQEVYDDLIKIHNNVSLYMKTLAVLADDKTYDLSKGVESLSSGIKKHPEFGIEDNHAESYTKITKVITKWITSSAQHKAVKEMIKEGDEPLQKILDGMMALVRYYKGTLENEKKSILGMFEVELLYEGMLTPENEKDRLLIALARAHVYSLEMEYNKMESKYDDTIKGIQMISEGHKVLRDSVEDISNNEAKKALRSITKDIKSITDNLKSIEND